MFRPFRALANWGFGVPRAPAYHPGRQRTTQGGGAPRVALRSTLGYLIMRRWGGGMVIHRTKPDGFMPQRGARGKPRAKQSAALGFGTIQFSLALKGRKNGQSHT